jgi:hypothetical protein
VLHKAECGVESSIQLRDTDNIKGLHLESIGFVGTVHDQEVIIVLKEDQESVYAQRITAQSGLSLANISQTSLHCDQVQE